MKTQEQRIEDAVEAARDAVGCHMLTPESVRDLVGVIREVADRETLKWPSDATVMYVWNRSAYKPSELRPVLREALQLDPIIKAALAMRDKDRGGAAPNYGARALFDVINKAGL